MPERGMLDLSPLGLAVIAAFLLAGFVKGAIGFGLPTVAIGLLSLAMAPFEAAAILVVPSFVTNIWQIARGRNLVALTRRLAPMLIGVLAGTIAGARLLGLSGNAATTFLLGASLVVYAGLGLARIRFEVSPAAERWLSPGVGLINGLITAATGIFVIPGTPYVQALAFDKDDLVQALGIHFLVATLAIAVVLAGDGMLTPSVAGRSIAALIAALIGMGLGQLVRARISENTFRRGFFAALLLLGLHIAARAAA